MKSFRKSTSGATRASRPLDVAIALTQQRRRTFWRAASALSHRLLPYAEQAPRRLRGFLHTLSSHRFAFETHAARLQPETTRGLQVLLASHELSPSGAPYLLLEIARLLLDAGHEVTLISLLPGTLCQDFIELGVPVIVPVNSTALKKDLQRIAASADLAICNTVSTRAIVNALAGQLPTLWYLHEVSLLTSILAAQDGLPAVLRKPATIWAGSELTARFLRELRPDVAVVPYGLPAISGPAGVVPKDFASTPLRLSVFASYESRKGQDLLVQALGLLPPDRRAVLRLTCYGRVLDTVYFSALQRAAEPFSEIGLHPETDLPRYHAAVLASHAVVVPSRDDTLPLVSLDALGAGRVLMCTATTGTADYLADSTSGFVASVPTSEALAEMLLRALDQRADWPTIAAAGQQVFRTIFSREAFRARLLVACAQLATSGPSRRSSS